MTTMVKIMLPTYINKEDWEGFVAMRKAIKKPLTPRAEKMALTNDELNKQLIETLNAFNQN